MKFKLYFIFFIYLLFTSVILAELEDHRCTEEFCQEYRETGKCIIPNTHCRENPNSTRFAYPDTCNCCEYCFKNLEKGDPCVLGQPGAVTPTEMCGPGLECRKKLDKSVCEEISSVCTKAQDEYDKRKKDGDLGMTEVRPDCDDDGFYKPVHCIPGSICYCLAPTGERIFGELPYLDYEDENKMTCGCSVNAWKAQKTVYSAHQVRVARCTEIGTYDELQCMMGDNSTCLCVNSETGSPTTSIDIVMEENINVGQPSCFDPSIHHVGSYSTKCEIEYEEYLRYLEEKEQHKIENSDGEELEINEPFCQPDGKFARMQSSGSKKICVDPDNNQIDRYEAESDSAEARNMDCNCARTHWLLAKAGVVELPTCCPNGNFEAWQCRRNECFCVDNNGNQIGEEVNIKERFKLKCYKRNEGKPCSLITLTS